VSTLALSSNISDYVLDKKKITRNARNTMINLNIYD